MNSASIVKSLVYDLISSHSFLNLCQHSTLSSSFVVVLSLQNFDAISTTNVAFKLRNFCRIGFCYCNHVNFFVNRCNLISSAIFHTIASSFLFLTFVSFQARNYFAQTSLITASIDTLMCHLDGFDNDLT